MWEKREEKKRKREKKAVVLEECHKTVKERASSKLPIRVGIDVADKEARWRH